MIATQSWCFDTVTGRWEVPSYHPARGPELCEQVGAIEAVAAEHEAAVAPEAPKPTCAASSTPRCDAASSKAERRGQPREAGADDADLGVVRTPRVRSARNAGPRGGDVVVGVRHQGRTAGVSTCMPLARAARYSSSLVSSIEP